MDILDRKTAPAPGAFTAVKYINPESHQLRNGVPVYFLEGGTQEVTRFHFIFEAGLRHSDKTFLPAATNQMLAEGTKKYSGVELAEQIDFYGSSRQAWIDHDWSGVGLTGLSKHSADVLPFIAEILNSATFPEKELSLLLNRNRQSLLINNMKVDYVCRGLFFSTLFGKNHPYGAILEEKNLNIIDRGLLLNYYNTNYKNGAMTVIVSGKPGSDTLFLLEENFGSSAFHAPSIQQNILPAPVSSTQKNIFIEKPDAVQSAIMIGRRLFTKTHPDYFPMLILNTVFGGYFGSRLMTNIREDKGYTYGIHSSIQSHLSEGYFRISTKVGVDVCKPALVEIYKELDRMKEEPIGGEELNLVRNYLYGSFLQSLDGPFGSAESFAGLLGFGLTYDYFDKYLETLQTVTPELLMELAQKYWNPEDFYEVVVGKM